MTVIAEHSIPGPHGSIRVRTYRPDGDSHAGIVWIHGGAFAMNDIDVPEAHWVSGMLAGAGITVVSPDYRLAGSGIHFPVLTDECAEAWRWAVGNRDLAVAGDDWHIGGGSAGGNLAAAVSMILRDANDSAPPPRSNVLVYPILHSPLPEPSPQLAAALRTLPPEELHSEQDALRINLNYVGRRELLQHPLAFPGHGELAGMPPTLIVNSEFDQLRSSGERYGAQLVAAGVDTVVIREADAHHGHLNFPEQPAAQRTVARMIGWLTDTPLRGRTHEGGGAGLSSDS